MPFQTVKSASAVNALPQASLSPRVQASARPAMMARIAASSLARVCEFCAAPRLHRIINIAVAASNRFIMVSSLSLSGIFSRKMTCAKTGANRSHGCREVNKIIENGFGETERRGSLAGRGGAVGSGFVGLAPETIEAQQPR